MKSDRGAALALISAAVLGLLLANSPFGPWLLQAKEFTLGPESLGLELSIEHWIKDLLLAVFFLVAGLELKYELRSGVLSRPATAMVPIVAALGGVLVPALIYFWFNSSGAGVQGWPIPTATDIAFALGVLAIFGRGMPKEARVFLLALAIFDDLIAILIIALFFTSNLKPVWLLVTAVAAAVLAYTEKISRFPHNTSRVVLFVVLWYSVLQSGIHPTIAGVLMGLVISAKRANSLIDRLQPVTNAFVLPVFAFSAVSIALPQFSQSPSSVFLGIVLALPIGKTLGIALFALIANRLASKEAKLALGAFDFVALGAIAGVGFTVSLLMTQLAFVNSPQLLAEATIAVVIGSLISMGLGAILITARVRHYKKLKTN